MNDCTQLSLDPASLDARKRVNYTLGMVLGEDDFRQEQAYFLEKHRLHHRALHGYGTVCGLRVTHEGAGKIRVSRGLATTPQGQEVRVCADQCGDLGSWLDRNADDVAAQVQSPPGPISVYVILCPRECETDTVPIAGGPCRTDEESMAASRITEAFEIRLSLTPPAQVEEDAVRQFGDLLRRIEISAEPGITLSPTAMADLVRSLIPLSGSPAPVVSPGAGSPPMPEVLRVNPEDLAEVLRAAFRTWATEVRPALLSEREHCACGQPDEECILLARLEATVSQSGGKWAVVGDPDIDESDRPVLLSTRVLQEALLCGNRLDTTWFKTFATLSLLRPDVLRVWIHHPDLVTLPEGAVEIEVNGAPAGSPSTVTAVAISPPIPGHNVFDLQLDSPLANGSRVTVRFDITQVEVGSDPAHTLAEELESFDYGYPDRNDQFLDAYLGVWLPALDDLSDVSVTGSPSNDGDVLTRRGDEWVPEPPASSVTDHGALSGLEDEDDHPQYLPVNPATKALKADLEAAGHGVTGMRQAAANGEAVPYEQAIKVDDDAGGDLSDKYPKPTVAKLRGALISATGPSQVGQVLRWTGTEWAPATIETAGGISITDVANELPTLPLATVTSAGRDADHRPRLRVWFHLKSGEPRTRPNIFEIKQFEINERLSEQPVRVFYETPNTRSFLTEVKVEGISREDRNVFLLTLNARAFEAGERFRLMFFPSKIEAVSALDNSEFNLFSGIISKTPLKWLGHDGKDTITIFYNKAPRVVVGRFGPNGEALAVTERMSATRPEDQRPGLYLVTFDGYSPQQPYAVTATPIIKVGSERPAPFVVGAFAEGGIALAWNSGETAPSEGFMVQIVEIV